MNTRSARQLQGAKAGVATKEATLTSGLAVVLREQSSIAALQHVVHALDDLVDVSWQWSIARACALESKGSSCDGGARRLVTRMVSRRPLEEMDTFHRQAQLSAGLVNAAQRGNEQLVRWLLDNIVLERFTVDSHSGILKAAEASASGGHLHILEEVLKHDKCGISIKPAMLSAARANNLEALKWLYEHLIPSTDLNDCASSLLEATAGVGNIEMASWLVDIVGADCLRLSVASAAQNAISGGHLSMVESLVDITSSISGPFCLDGAAGKGHLQAVQWGLQHGGACTTQAMNSAARNGHLEVVKWLHRYRTDGCTTQAIDDAAGHGHLGVVQWLHAHRCEGGTTKAMDAAASHGHLDVVTWLHRYRREGCTTTAMNGAARENHLDVVRWLHTHRTEGCTQEAMDGAASGGNVAMMQWLIVHRSGNCNFSRCALDNAAAGGHLEAVRWLFKQHSLSGTSGWIACDAMDRAASGGHLNVVKWFHERRPEVGSCSTAAMDGAASNGHLDMVKWLHSERREGATYRAMDGAAAGGHLEVMIFLYMNRSDGCTSDAAVKAALNEHVEVVQWLLQRYPQQICHERVRKFAARYNFSLLDHFNRSHTLPARAY